MDDYPRLSKPIACAIISVICFIAASGGEKMPDWFRMFLTAVGAIFAFAAFITGLDFIAYRVAARISDLSSARTAGPARLASALRGLTMSQFDFVIKMSAVNITGIISNAGPAFSIRGPVCDIPLDFAADFLAASQETAPYLFPERRAAEIGEGETGWANARQYAVELTNMIIANGWAERAVGHYAAKLLPDTTLDQLRVYFGVA